MGQGSRSVLVVVFGLPGTGKTTLARNLSDSLKARHLNTDMLRTTLGKRDRYTEAEKAEIYQILLEQAEAYLKEGRDLVVDGTFSRTSYRNAMRQLAIRTGATLKWIQVKASEEVVQERVGVKRPFSQADFEVYQKIRDAFEPLEENALEIWTDRQAQEESLEQMLQYLSE